MIATIDGDMIVTVGRGDTEIGDLPKGVGLERLRWDGSAIVDLATLSQIWVEPINGTFRLHCIPIGNSTLVDMRYADRKNLKINGSAPRVKTAEELAAEERTRRHDAARGLLLKKLQNVETVQEVLAFLLGLVSVALIYSRTNNEQLGTRIDAILDELQALPLQRMTLNAETKLTTIKNMLDEFYGVIDTMGGNYKWR